MEALTIRSIDPDARILIDLDNISNDGLIALREGGGNDRAFAWQAAYVSLWGHETSETSRSASLSELSRALTP